jgi:hypothetical protein
MTMAGMFSTLRMNAYSKPAGSALPKQTADARRWSPRFYRHKADPLPSGANLPDRYLFNR